MNIGIPKEIKEQEFRVSLLPSAAYQLVKRGHRVAVEKDAGEGIGISDAEYKSAGAIIVNTHEEAFEVDLVVKVKEPLPSEIPLLKKGQILFTYLHLAANRALTEGLLASGATCIAYETVEVNKRLPLLEPMSEIAGRMSVIMGGYFLAKHNGGKGVLLGGVPGVLPGKVVVIGGGTSGLNAARMATGLGADVTGFIELSDGDRIDVSGKILRLDADDSVAITFYNGPTFAKMMGVHRAIIAKYSV